MAWGLERISSRELSEWMIFDSVEPIGDRRSDWQFAMLAAMIANVNRDRKKRSQPYTPNDFVPDFEKRWESARSPDEATPWEHLLEIVQMWNAALGGKDERDNT